MFKKSWGILFALIVFLSACEPVSVDELNAAKESASAINTPDNEAVNEIVEQLPLEKEAKEEVKGVLSDAQENRTEIVPVENISVQKVEDAVLPPPMNNSLAAQPLHKPRTITIEKLDLSTRELLIFPNTEVIWKNNDILPHQITGPGFSSQILNQNDEFKHTFTKPGKYRFNDELHQNLWGSVNVIDVTSLGITVSEPDDLVWITIENYQFNPLKVNIKPGQVVVWENRDPMAHTVKGPGFSSPVLMSGKKFQYKFEQPGTYIYECTKHDYTIGTIVVG